MIRVHQLLWSQIVRRKRQVKQHYMSMIWTCLLIFSSWKNHPQSARWNIVRGEWFFVCVASRSAITSHHECEITSNVKTDNYIRLVVHGVQSADHQTRLLGDWKQTRAAGDHELEVETDWPERRQRLTEGLTGRSSSSTDVSPVCVKIPPPAHLLPGAILQRSRLRA